MKYLKTYSEKCIGCHTCEDVCSQLFFKKEDHSLSCIKVETLNDGFNLNVCNQCGACVKVCPTLALSINAHGVVMLNKQKCIGCLACVSACPSQSMRHIDNSLTPFKCVACGSCASKCPVQALEIVNERS